VSFIETSDDLHVNPTNRILWFPVRLDLHDVFLGSREFHLLSTILSPEGLCQKGHELFCGRSTECSPHPAADARSPETAAEALAPGAHLSSGSPSCSADQIQAIAPGIDLRLNAPKHGGELTFVASLMVDRGKELKSLSIAANAPK
jgi:hypothetical protein